MKYYAGWNMPGYMPEEPYAEFDTFEEAKEYIVDELQRVLDDLYVQDCPLEAKNCEHVIEWVKKQNELFVTRAVNQYHYCVEAES